ncbi:MAG: CD0415/CD1112 family protein [Oscillospiraceae bacterium]|nr:CD0415/CD1112 family protein [Oscillospiraceae bacterium]
MTWLIDSIDSWLREMLLDAAMNSFTNMLHNVNASVQDVAYQVGQTPQGWNAGIFTMVRNLSETVILPIAGIILTFVLCYELIQLIIEKNNMHDFDTFNIFKWIGKSFVAVLILTNTWNIVMGIFDLAQGVVNQSAGLITSDLTLGSPDMLLAIATQLEALGTGELLVLFLQVQVVGLLMEIMAIVITIIVWGRMIEIYLVSSIAPIPLATMVNREWGQMGNNYLKSLLALGFQGFLIMICLAIYAVLVANFVLVGSMTTTIWSIVAYTALLCFMLLKSGGIAKSIFSAH